MNPPSGPREIIFLTSDMPVGGGETLLVDLVNRFDRRRITPVVVSLAGVGESEKRLSPDVEIIHFPRRSRFDLVPAKEIGRLILERNVSAVFAKGSFCFFFAKLAMRKSPPSVQLFVSLHTTKPRSVKEYLVDLALWRMLTGNDSLLTVCASQARFLSRKYYIPERLFETVYNGVDLSHWTFPPANFARADQRANWGIPPEAFIIVHVAMFRGEKRQDDAIRALSFVHKRTEAKPYLLFVGDGDAAIMHSFHRLSSDLGMEKYVRFCGRQEDVRPFYWMSDLFALTSVSETFSIAALEAMATGLPCVLTDLGGAREMVAEGISGFCVLPGNPEKIAEGWIRVIRARDHFSPMLIRRRIEDQFSFEKCLRRYEDLLAGGELT
jgi:glycosyltransferase involved in cell wall biosynthesis